MPSSMTPLKILIASTILDNFTSIHAAIRHCDGDPSATAWGAYPLVKPQFPTAVESAKNSFQTLRKGTLVQVHQPSGELMSLTPEAKAGRSGAPDRQRNH